jgi:Na+-driven multidrug efflux pump
LLFYLLGQVLGLGLTGVWWGIVFTTWTGALGMLFLARFEFRKVSKGIEISPREYDQSSSDL